MSLTSPLVRSLVRPLVTPLTGRVFETFSPLDIESLLRFWWPDDAATNLTTADALAADGNEIRKAVCLKTGLVLSHTTGPTLDADRAPGSKRAHLFNGTNQALFTTTNIVPVPSTWMGMVQQVSPTSTDRIWDTSNGGSRTGLYQRSNAGTDPVALRGNNDSLAGAAQYLGKWDIITVITTATTVVIKRNSETLASGAAGGTPVNVRYAEGAVAANPPASGFGNVALGARCIFDGILSDDDQALMRQWFRDQYENTHLGQVICDGNSITAGALATGGLTYPNQLAALYGSGNNLDILVRNFGVGGQQTPAMTADAATQIDALFDRERRYNIVIALEILNHWNQLVGTGTAARTASDLCLTAYFDYLTARKSAGFKVIGSTVMPTVAYSIGANATELSYVNSAIRNSSIPHRIIQPDVDARLSNPANGTYYGDGTHPINAGYAVLAELAKAQVDSLI